ncbi:GNAT family N-acetyltransferase [Clostridium butyricum]|uniref:GNAT family N-acetyltransferase n=1 Tax=Clostridium butyricum TaxID=1492 RepID=UPI0013D2CD35|nr:GNAT family N-acetyltransferase [Clostridium butyricum]MCQ2012675.1 GNAT family N-acetyltransferase [Clostridium butyricum]MCQ2017034.1 GNAT family N-acetyltransferase [Clostridium butyricum]MCQ2020934.1 GNAT family N-acetyltransferase [Clostridium butyricum]MCQ2025085.1 GNAT family N-acetyltransferase [Clostridium butyricum]NFB72076.1 GNAT family N-acetyltransferase [Clostridium butyricum]
MELLEKKVLLKDGTKCILRSPNYKDAASMLEHLKITSDETYFMVRYPEEITIKVEEEEESINCTINSKTDLMIAAFVNNELVGNAGIKPIRNHIKLKHRAGFGISIKQKYWNNGIGDILINEIISEAGLMGYEQIELGVFADNKRAQYLYKKNGFEVWGNTKNAFKLKDGTYRDEIIMGRSIL